MTLKVRILRCSRRLFIILVSLTMTWFSEKMLISTRCIHGFMSILIKKSWTESRPPAWYLYTAGLSSPISKVKTNSHWPEKNYYKNRQHLEQKLNPNFNFQNLSFQAQIYRFLLCLGGIHKLRLLDEVGRWSKNVHFL